MASIPYRARMPHVVNNIERICIVVHIELIFIVGQVLLFPFVSSKNRCPPWVLPFGGEKSKMLRIATVRNELYYPPALFDSSGMKSTQHLVTESKLILR